MFNVAYASDANYSIPMAVSMLSCAANLSGHEETTFWLISDGISPDFIDTLRSRIERINSQCQLEVLNPAQEISQLHFRDYKNHLNRSTLLRLLFPKLLPKDVTKLFYIDSDTVVVGPLPLSADHHHSPAAVTAARDFGTLFFEDRWPDLEGTKEGKHHYFNAGILLLDLDVWRQENIAESLFHLLATTNRNMQYQDQDAINWFFQGKITEIDWTYNLQTAAFTFTGDLRRKVISQAHELGYAESKRHEARIIHYTGPKPWVRGMSDPFRPAWWKALSKHQPVGIWKRQKMKARWYRNFASRTLSKAW
ncbi:MAG TPA: glycosyltransferase [Phycisphaerae bacterium]|nr:glycosyltransferase [Phycisphaerae bacterium]